MRTGVKPGLRGGSALLIMALCLMAGQARADRKQAIEQALERSRALMAGEKPVINPGDWVSYRMHVKLPMGRVDSLIKVSAPLHTDPDHPLLPGRYWLEFELGDPEGKTDSVAVLKMLIHGDPRGPKAIEKMYLKAGRRTPMELGEKWLNQAQSAEPGGGAPCLRCQKSACASKGGQVQRGAEKNLYTRAGWIKARRVTIRFPNSDKSRIYWFSDQVPMFHFVKASLENAIDLDLEAYGTGALSRIDETRAVPLPDPDQLEETMSGISPENKEAEDGQAH